MTLAGGKQLARRERSIHTPWTGAATLIGRVNDALCVTLRQCHVQSPQHQLRAQVGEIVNEVLNPSVVCVPDRWVAVGPALVAAQQFARPVAYVERRVASQDSSGIDT